MNKKVSPITMDPSAISLPPPLFLEPIHTIKTFSDPISPISKMLGIPQNNFKKITEKPPSVPPPPVPKITISRETKHRLISDIKDLIINPLTSHGIYYIHDEENMLKASALIIGPSDTIYADGFFLFKFKIPHNYPYAPPVVTFHTQGSNIRFNPNLYRNGKVCLSILNTWKGEQWTSCQTLRSVLLTLVTLFHNKPLLNEPGLTETYRDYKSYNKIIEFHNYKTAILDMASQINLPAEFFSFYSFIKKHFIKNYDEINKRLEKHTQKEIETLNVPLYNMKDVVIDYKKIKEQLYILFLSFRP